MIYFHPRGPGLGCFDLRVWTMYIPDEIATARLILRRIRRDDAAAIFNGYSSHAEAARFMSFPVNRLVAEAQAFVDRSIQAWTDGHAYHFVICSMGHEVIGACGMERASGGSDHHFSFGYCLSPCEWNKGFATEVASAFRDWFLTAPEVYRLSAVVDVENPASCRVLEKAGFSFEGILRRWAIHPNLSSEPRDVKMYARVK